MTHNHGATVVGQGRIVLTTGLFRAMISLNFLYLKAGPAIAGLAEKDLETVSAPSHEHLPERVAGEE